MHRGKYIRNIVYTNGVCVPIGRKYKKGKLEVKRMTNSYFMIFYGGTFIGSTFNMEFVPYQGGSSNLFFMSFEDVQSGVCSIFFKKSAKLFLQSIKLSDDIVNSFVFKRMVFTEKTNTNLEEFDYILGYDEQD